MHTVPKTIGWKVRMAVLLHIEEVQTQDQIYASEQSNISRTILEHKRSQLYKRSKIHNHRNN